MVTVVWCGLTRSGQSMRGMKIKKSVGHEKDVTLERLGWTVKKNQTVIEVIRNVDQCCVCASSSR